MVLSCLDFESFGKIDWLPKKQIGYWCGVCKVVYVMFAVVIPLTQHKEPNA